MWVCVSETDGLDQVKKKRRPCVGVLHGPLACEPQGYIKILKKNKKNTHIKRCNFFRLWNRTERVMRGKVVKWGFQLVDEKRVFFMLGLGEISEGWWKHIFKYTQQYAVLPLTCTCLQSTRRQWIKGSVGCHGVYVTTPSPIQWALVAWQPTSLSPWWLIKTVSKMHLLIKAHTAMVRVK